MQHHIGGVNTNISDRPLAMVGLLLEDFDINPSNIEDINNINALAGGKADIAFLAYNRDAFEIKAPVITELPLSRSLCVVPSDKDITFNVEATVDGGSTGDPKENLGISVV